MKNLKNNFNIIALATSMVLISGCATLNFGKQDHPVTDAGPISTEQVYFEKAQTALAKGQYNEATKSLEAIKNYFPTGEYIEQAELELIYTKFQQKDYASAVTLSERFIQLYPHSERLDYAFYVRGVSNMEQNYDSLIRYTSLQHAHRDLGYLKLAYQNFKDLIVRYPSSQYAVDAAQRMTFIGQELAESELNIARYSLERKMWVAALRRAQWVLERYPQTPQVPEAIATIAYAYKQLGNPESAKQYMQILQANYPHLIKSNGEVNLTASRNERSLLNKATLGLFGNNDDTQNVSHPNVFRKTPSQHQDEQHRSLLNRFSFGLLDKEAEEVTQPTPQIIPLKLEEPQSRSLMNKLSFGLLDKETVEPTVVKVVPVQVTPPEPEATKPSLLNKFSFGLLDKEKAE